MKHWHEGSSCQAKCPLYLICIASLLGLWTPACVACSHHVTDLTHMLYCRNNVILRCWKVFGNTSDIKIVFTPTWASGFNVMPPICTLLKKGCDKWLDEAPWSWRRCQYHSGPVSAPCTHSWVTLLAIAPTPSPVPPPSPCYFWSFSPSLLCSLDIFPLWHFSCHWREFAVLPEFTCW